MEWVRQCLNWQCGCSDNHCEGVLVKIQLYLQFNLKSIKFYVKLIKEERMHCWQCVSLGQFAFYCLVSDTLSTMFTIAYRSKANFSLEANWVLPEERCLHSTLHSQITVSSSWAIRWFVINSKNRQRFQQSHLTAYCAVVSLTVKALINPSK